MVAANIAVSLASITNTTVGIIDCDVYGPTIPLLFDRDNATLKGVNDKIFPERVDNVEIISTAFLTPDNSPVMWRAPMLSKLLKSFFTDVVFSADVKYIVLDMPPGTGDVSIDLKTLAPNSHVLIVSTRDKIASSIALKAGLGAKQLGLDILGVVENMTHYVESDISVFGDKETGIEKQLDTELLGSIPFIKGDKLVVGKMSVYFDLIVKRILDKLNFKY
jgi:ATP-binding protein involved in chromosome partitioning